MAAAGPYVMGTCCGAVGVVYMENDKAIDAMFPQPRVASSLNGTTIHCKK